MEIYIKNSKKIRILAKTAHKSRNSYYRFALSGYDYNMLNTGGWWCYKMAEDVSGIYTGIIGIITEQTPFAQILTNDRFKFFNNAQPKLKIHQGSFPASYSSLFTIHETPQLLLRYFLKDETWFSFKCYSTCNKSRHCDRPRCDCVLIPLKLNEH